MAEQHQCLQSLLLRGFPVIMLGYVILKCVCIYFFIQLVSGLVLYFVDENCYQ
jgi:hypothetical protein